MNKVTIIGAGLGGLTAGALLAKDGYKVTILEQHNIVGGSATTFKRKGGFTCEVGLHEMDSAFEDADKKKIFETLGVYDNIEFVKSDEFFKVNSESIDFTMPDEKEEAIKLLVIKFPKQKEQILKYFSLIQKISNEFEKLSHARWWHYIFFPFIFSNILRFKTKSVKDVMNNLIDNDELKLILNANVGYYNDKIASLSFLYHAIAQNSYFTGSGWFIKGGSQQLSNYLSSVIKENDGSVITKANVIKINHNSKDISSVTYIHKKEEIEVLSDIVISNISPSETYKKSNVSYIEEKINSSSLLTIYLGFNRNIKEIYGKNAYSTFLFRDISSMEEYDENVSQDISKRGFVFVDYSQIDSGLTDENKSFGAMCTTDYIEDWEELSKDEYKLKKKEVLENYLNELEKYYPKIQQYIELAEVATAKTMKRYLKTSNGTAYGFKANPEQFFRKPKVKSDKLNNLYFVGAWVIGGGFTPAIISGNLCYKKISKS